MDTNEKIDKILSLKLNIDGIDRLKKILLADGQESKEHRVTQFLDGYEKYVDKEQTNKKSMKNLVSKGKNDSAFVTTTGLVIHSIADGVALGASLFCK